MACWPRMYVASLPARNTRVSGAFVLDIAAFATHQVSGQALCSMALIKNLNRIRIRVFFLETGQNRRLTRFCEL